MTDSTDEPERPPDAGERERRRYETMIQTLGDATYTLDAEGRFTAVNEAFVESTGYAREALLGEHVSIVMDETDIDVAEAAIRDLLTDAGRDRATFGMSLYTENGDRVPCENHIALLRTANGEFRGTVGVLRDVTEREERERALREERAFTENVLDAIPDVFYVFDEEGEFLRWNDRLTEVTGYTDAEIAAMHPTDLVHEEDVETIGEAIAAITEDGGSRTRESRLLTKNGEAIPYRFNGSLVTDSEGGVQGIIGTAQDVSESRERERTLEALHDATRTMMTAATSEAVCEIAVDAAERVLGYPITVVRLLDEEEDTLVPTAMTEETRGWAGERPAYSVRDTPAGRAYETGDTRVYEDIHDTDDDYEKGNARAAMYAPLGDHGVISIADTGVGTFERADVGLANVLAANTEAALDRVEREERLRTREEELRRHNARLEEFASVVSHDIRNPLNVITGNLALARKTGDPKHLEPIERAAERVNRLTEDLLILARGGRTVDDPQPTRIAPIVADAWAVVGRESARLAIDERLSKAPAVWGTIEADPVRLQGLFENLLANAIEHGGSDTVVEVGPLSDAPGFHVADDGPGIDPANRERIFDHDYTTSEHGIGLGLTIVETVTDAHGWRVRVTESEAGGARFEFRTG
jgi:PAS domain S-box-containing protein